MYIAPGTERCNVSLGFTTPWRNALLPPSERAAETRAVMALWWMDGRTLLISLSFGNGPCVTSLHPSLSLSLPLSLSFSLSLSLPLPLSLPLLPRGSPASHSSTIGGSTCSPECLGGDAPAAGQAHCPASGHTPGPSSGGRLGWSIQSTSRINTITIKMVDVYF